MIHETFGFILAGLGLFFIGLKTLSTALQQVTSRKMRLLLVKWTNKPYQGGLIGLLSGILTQSMSALSFIVASMITAGMMTVRQAMPVILWGNVGCSLLVFIVFLDIKIITLFIIGIAGICLYFERPRQFQQTITILFGLGLLLYGLNIVQTSAASFAEEAWFVSFINYAVYSYFLALLSGVILSVISQSSAAISILAISMTSAGIFTIEQTMMIIYGSNLGSSVITYILSSKLRGKPKQLVMTQVLFNIFAVIILVSLFYTEVEAGIPLVKALVINLSDNLERQLALIYLLLNIAGAISLSLFKNSFARLLERYWPATIVEEWSQLAYIHDNMLHDSESALALMRLEQERLIKRFPAYMASVRHVEDEAKPHNHNSVNEAFLVVSKELRAFENELMKANLSHESSEALMKFGSRLKITENLNDVLHTLSEVLVQWSVLSNGNNNIQSFLESMDLLLLVLSDAISEDSKEDLELLQQLTHDRSDTMQKMRKTYLSEENNMTATERTTFLQATSLFERAVWLINQFAQ